MIIFSPGYGGYCQHLCFVYSLLYQWIHWNLGCFDHLYESSSICRILEVCFTNSSTYEHAHTHTKFSHARTDHFAMELQDRDRNRTLGIPTGVKGRWFTQLEVQEFLCFHCCMISTWLLEIFYLEMFEEISDYLVTWRAIIQGENVPVTYNIRGIFNEILCNAFCFTTKLRRVFSRKDNIFSVYIFFIQLQPNKCLHSQIESEGLCNSNGTIFASF